MLRFIAHWRARFLRLVHKAMIPLVTRSWKLPVKYYLYLLDADCEPELHSLEKICRQRATAIDVGANLGFYSYKMARLFTQVYAFEINSELLGNLKDFKSPRVQIYATGLSSRSASATLYIPVVKDIALTGWGSLDRNSCPDTHRHVEKTVNVIALDSLQIRSVSLIKIDVEGHELEVLQGAQQTLIDCRPVMIVEVRPKNLAAVENFLTTLDYRRQRLEDLANTRGSEQNFIFLPSESCPKESRGTARAAALANPSR